jgi:hypothetical protein
MPGGGWTPKRFAAARKYLLEMGKLELVRQHGISRGAAVYQWPKSRLSKREKVFY